MSLTDLKIDLPRGCRTKYLTKCVEGTGAIAKWTASESAQRIAGKQRRASLSDFERFQVKALNKKKQRIISAIEAASK